MKPNQLKKKLSLKKITIVSLQNVEMGSVKGGHTARGCDRTEPVDCNTMDISCYNCIDIPSVTPTDTEFSCYPCD